MKRSEVVAAARSWLHTPYQKDQCLKGVGADCVCLVKSAYLAAGAVLPNIETKQLASGIGKDTLLSKFFLCGFVETATPRDGDIIIWSYSTHPHHTGIVTRSNAQPIEVIHCSDCYNKVHEHQLVGQWINRFVAFLTHPQLRD